MAFSSCLPQASEGVKIHPQRDRKHNDFHHKLRPNHTVKAKNQIHHDEQGDIQQSLAAERQHGGLYALFSNRYFSASCSMDIIAFFQKWTDSSRLAEESACISTGGKARTGLSVSCKYFRQPRVIIGDPAAAGSKAVGRSVSQPR